MYPCFQLYSRSSLKSDFLCCGVVFNNFKIQGTIELYDYIFFSLDVFFCFFNLCLFRVCFIILDGNILHTCCNKDQLMTLSTSIVQAANFLHRCPSCMRTFGRFICEMVCSPKQSRFMRATKWSANGQCKYITVIYFYFLKLFYIWKF